ncbi:MAG: phosphatase PAP2 family protein [Deltaproteobacteria bacterium]|nr:MAG: phosphatase PAP2 family protein [Deltaproteobacteria bacterium]
MKLNPLDRLTAGYYSAGWSSLSDYLLYGLGATTAGLLLADEGLLDTLNDGVVIAEATLSATGAASIMTLAAGRPRPFLYGDPTVPSGYKAPLSIRNSADANLSFLSSHTAEAFAIVTSLYVAEHRLHPRSSYPRYILGVGLGVASLIGVARVMSGYHFIRRQRRRPGDQRLVLTLLSAGTRPTTSCRGPARCRPPTARSRAPCGCRAGR